MTERKFIMRGPIKGVHIEEQYSFYDLTKLPAGPRTKKISRNV